MIEREVFLVTTIATYNDGEIFLPTPVFCICIEDAKKVEEATFNAIDKDICKQLDVYIDVYPIMRRESHNFWRR